MPLHLLPEPKDLKLVKGLYPLDENTLILLPDAARDPAFVAAGQLQAEIQAVTGLDLPIVKAFAPPRPLNAIFLVCGEEEAAAFGIDPVQTGAPSAVASQAYFLTIQRGRIILYAREASGLYYAVQTLRQVVRSQGAALPTLVLHDWPSLRYRGLMLDVSRRKVPTLDTLKHLVRELSHHKLNVLQLYTEHTFRFPRHPSIGDGCGSLTSQDILDLDLFCRQHHVELMPNLQSFGHARNTLLLPEYRHLAESDLLWTLSPVFEGTYRLLDELYGDMLPSFTSTTLNVNCDEPFDLGQGASRSLVEAEGLPTVYLDHLLRLRDLAARYGRRIQVWGDVLLRHPELLHDLPDDVTVLDWQYHPAPEYPSARVFARAGRRFWVCPGTGSWNSLFPRLNDARTNIRTLVRDGVRAGSMDGGTPALAGGERAANGVASAPGPCEGSLLTDWGDFGHYQHLGLSWHAYLFGAAQAWTGGTTGDAAFDAAFGALFLGPAQESILDALKNLAATNELPGIAHLNRSHTVLALFDEPLRGETVHGPEALPASTLARMRALADAAARTCDALARGHPREQTLREMASAARLTAFAARKTALGQSIRETLHRITEDARQPEDPGYARALHDSSAQLRELAIELDGLRAEWEVLWLARARRSEIQVALGYFAGLRTRLEAAAGWLEGQQQALLAGQSVDADLSTYEGGDYRVLWQTWPD